MSAVIVNPATYDKYRAFAEATELVKQFCDLNHLTAPRITTMDLRGPGLHGYYSDGVIVVDLEHSLRPVMVPGYQWSYTGYKADMTAPGVLAHELGHHVWLELCLSPNGHQPDKARTFRRVCGAEPAVTSYEPDFNEAFAEAFRLFLLNPDLLREGRSQRYGFMRDELLLESPEFEDWREVLRYAHPKLVKAAESWIKKGNVTSSSTAMHESVRKLP